MGARLPGSCKARDEADTTTLTRSTRKGPHNFVVGGRYDDEDGKLHGADERKWGAQTYQECYAPELLAMEKSAYRLLRSETFHPLNLASATSEQAPATPTPPKRRTPAPSHVPPRLS